MEKESKLRVHSYTYTNVSIGEYPEMLLLSDYVTGGCSVELKHIVDKTVVRIPVEHIPAVIQALELYQKEKTDGLN